MDKINIDILLEIADYSLYYFDGVSEGETVGSGEQIGCIEYILNQHDISIPSLNNEEWQLCLEAVGTGIDDAIEGWQTNSDYKEAVE
jgi:hypothetical protein